MTWQLAPWSPATRTGHLFCPDMPRVRGELRADGGVLLSREESVRWAMAFIGRTGGLEEDEDFHLTARAHCCYARDATAACVCSRTAFSARSKEVGPSPAGPRPPSLLASPAGRKSPERRSGFPSGRAWPRHVTELMELRRPTARPTSRRTRSTPRRWSDPSCAPDERVQRVTLTVTCVHRSARLAVTGRDALTAAPALRRGVAISGRHNAAHAPAQARLHPGPSRTGTACDRRGVHEAIASDMVAVETRDLLPHLLTRSRWDFRGRRRPRDYGACDDRTRSAVDGQL